MQIEHIFPSKSKLKLNVGKQCHLLVCLRIELLNCTKTKTNKMKERNSKTISFQFNNFKANKLFLSFYFKTLNVNSYLYIFISISWLVEHFISKKKKLSLKVLMTDPNFPQPRIVKPPLDWNCWFLNTHINSWYTASAKSVIILLQIKHTFLHGIRFCKIVLLCLQWFLYILGKKDTFKL